MSGPVTGAARRGAYWILLLPIAALLVLGAAIAFHPQQVDCAAAVTIEHPASAPSPVTLKGSAVASCGAQLWILDQPLDSHGQFYTTTSGPEPIGQASWMHKDVIVGDGSKGCHPHEFYALMLKGDSSDKLRSAITSGTGSYFFQRDSENATANGLIWRVVSRSRSEPPVDLAVLAESSTEFLLTGDASHRCPNA